MQFKLTNSIVDKVWSVLFTNIPSQLTNNDREIMRKYGEPLVNVGGVFLSGTENEFSFPNEYRKIRNEFPFKREFDTRDPDFEDNVLTKIGAYSDAILFRITTELDTLRAKTDNFSGETVIHVGDITYVDTNTIESWVIGEEPSGIINGDNQVFTLTKPVSANKIVPYLNGLRLRQDHFDILSLDQFRLHDAPLENDTIIVDYVSLFTL